MPFVKSAAPLMLGHMQAPGDGVRAAAEKVDRQLSGSLYAAWRGFTTLAEFEQEIRPLAHPLLQANAGGRQAMFSEIGLIRKFSIGFEYDRLAPQTMDAADQYAGQFVREIGDDVRTTINAMTQEGIQTGLGPEELARTIRESIGLTQFQARAVQNYRRALEMGSPDALDYRLRDARFDATTARHIAGDIELTPEQIDARVARYRERYLAYRANTIARFETLHASNAGAVTAMQSAAKTGLVNGTVVKDWLIAQDEITCDRCRSIPEAQPDGIPLDQAFQWTHVTKRGTRSGLVPFAPLHGACRCTVTFRVR